MGKASENLLLSGVLRKRKNISVRIFEPGNLGRPAGRLFRAGGGGGGLGEADHGVAVDPGVVMATSRR